MTPAVASAQSRQIPWHLPWSPTGRVTFTEDELRSYERDFVAAVAKACGATLGGECLTVDGFPLRLTVAYQAFSCRGEVELAPLANGINGFYCTWPIRAGVLVKPTTVAKHISRVAKLAAVERRVEQERARISAINGPIARRLEQLNPYEPLLRRHIGWSTSEEGKVYVQIPHQSFLCTEAQAEALIKALNALPLPQAAQ